MLDAGFRRCTERAFVEALIPERALPGTELQIAGGCFDLPAENNLIHLYGGTVDGRAGPEGRLMVTVPLSRPQALGLRVENGSNLVSNLAWFYVEDDGLWPEADRLDPASGAAGDRVELHGSGLSGECVVTFKPAEGEPPFDVVTVPTEAESDSLHFFTVPAVPYQLYEVTVTNGEGREAGPLMFSVHR